MENILDNISFNNEEITDKERFKFYKSFHSLEPAKEFAMLLQENDIRFLAETSGTVIDEVIVGTGLVPKVVIKIEPENFPRVNNLIADQYADLDYKDLQDHYLNQLDEEELMEIFLKPDEWSAEDIAAAKIIAKGRGLAISDEEVQELRNQRLNTIRAGKKGNVIWMILYFLGIVLGLIVSLIFTIAGIGMAYYYAYGKSVDIDGNRHYVFDEKTRNIGTLMLYGGVGLLLIEMGYLYWMTLG